MIELVQGDIFASNSDAIINTVNCVGVMGKGLALEFKKRYPAYYIKYVQVCKLGKLRPGSLYFYKVGAMPLIISFPTKDHWRNPSKIEWIEQGLVSLRETINNFHGTENEIRSLSIPALGCQNGGLNWKDVKPLIVEALKDVKTKILVFEPLTLDI